MSEEKPKAVVCPNCQRGATMSGNVITCENCDAEYKIKRKEATIKKLGPLKALEDRVLRLEGLAEPAEPAEPVEPESDSESESDEEPIL